MRQSFALLNCCPFMGSFFVLHTFLPMFAFIDEAEKAFNDNIVLEAAFVEPYVMLNGSTYRVMSPKFDSPEKIKQYFERYWSVEISQILLDNIIMNEYLKNIDGKWYSLQGNPDYAATIRDKSYIQAVNGDEVTVVTSAFYRVPPGEYKITYKLKWTDGGWKIVAREGQILSSMFE